MTVMELNVVRRGPLDGVVEAYSPPPLGSLAQMGFAFAALAERAERSEAGAAAAQLSWWAARARVALDRVGPL